MKMIGSIIDFHFLFCTKESTQKYLSTPHVAFVYLWYKIDPVIMEKDLSLSMRIHWQCGGLLNIKCSKRTLSRLLAVALRMYLTLHLLLFGQSM